MYNEKVERGQNMSERKKERKKAVTDTDIKKLAQCQQTVCTTQDSLTKELMW
jgi:hypothetical protein